MKLIKMMADQVLAFVILGIVVITSFLLGFFVAKVYYSAAIKNQKEVQESIDALVNNPISAPVGGTWCKLLPIDDYVSPKGIKYTLEVCEDKN